MKRTTLEQVLDRVFSLGFEPSTIIDVGVAYGTNGLYGKIQKAFHLLVEPLQEYESVCKDLTSKYGGEYLIAAAGAELGELELNVHPDLSGSSLLKESEGPQIDGKPRMVPVITLDSVCSDKGCSGPYLLKLDTQGTELEVLKGAEFILKETELVLVEVSLFEFYKGSPLLAEIVRFMDQRDFVVYDIFGGAYRPLDGALGQIDFVFAKRDGFLRESNHWATPEQRKVLLEKRMATLNPRNGPHS